MAETDQERGQSAHSEPPHPGAAPHPGGPSDGSDPASNEAGEADPGDAGEYAEALRKIGDQPRPE